MRQSPTLLLRAHHCLAYLALGVSLGCGSFTDPAPELTHPAYRGEFEVSVEAHGETEAKNAHTIVAPMLNWAGTQVSWLPPEGTYVRKDDVVAELEASQIKRAYINALDEREISKADAEKGVAELAMEHDNLQSQLKNTQASLKSAKLQLSRMAFEPTKAQEIRRLQIRQHELELEKIQKKLASNEKVQEEERTRLRLKVGQAESKVQQAKFQLSQLELTAPVDGFVQYAKLWNGDKVTRGSQLWPHMPIVKIPDLSVMQVKLQIGESEAQKLSKDQHAVVTIPSLEDLRLSGKVTRIDKVAKAVRKNRKTTKVKRVEVVVELDTTYSDLVPGLTAHCRITVDALKNAITLPQECVFDADSVKVVYVLDGERYIPRAVTVAKYGENFVALHSDLTGGEQCALRQPPESRIDWPARLTSPAPPPSEAAPQTLDSDSSQTKKVLSLEKGSPEIVLSKPENANQ